MQRSIEGDAVAEARASFAAFYAREAERQVRRAFLLTGSNETANDIVHDAFVAIYPRYDRLEHAGRYLNQAVLNGCRDRARRVVRQHGVLARLGVEQATPPIELLDDALAALPFNQRAAVVLRYYARMPHDEIAAALGCPIGSVGPWIARGLAQLRKDLT